MLYAHMTASHADWGSGRRDRPRTPARCWRRRAIPGFDAATRGRTIRRPTAWTPRRTRCRPGFGGEADHDRRRPARGRHHAGHDCHGRPDDHKGGASSTTTTRTRTGTKITLPGHPRVLVQRRHDHGRRASSARQKLYEYQKLFGFGRPPMRAAGRVAGSVAAAVAVERCPATGSIPIGMGISVTPLQMTAAYAAIANNGVVGPAAPGQGAPSRRTANHARRRRRPRTRCCRPADRGGSCARCWRRSTTVDGRHRHDGRGHRLPGGRQDRHRQQWSRQLHCRATSSRSSAWRRPTHPQYVIGVFAHVHGAAAAAAWPARRSTT